MYHNQSAHHRDGDRNGRESNGYASHQPGYPAYPPSSRPQSSSTGNNAMTGTLNHSPRQPLPSSPGKAVYTPHESKSRYYDPTSESRSEYRASSRDGNASYSATPPFAARSPHQTLARPQTFDHQPPPPAVGPWYNSSSGPGHAPESSLRGPLHHSPNATDHHAHPVHRPEHPPYSSPRHSHASPASTYAHPSYPSTNGSSERPILSPQRPAEPVAVPKTPEQPKREGAANPMSFSAMLSGPSAAAAVETKTEAPPPPPPAHVPVSVPKPIQESRAFETSVAPPPRAPSPLGPVKEVNMDDARNYTPKQAKASESVKKVKLPKATSAPKAKPSTPAAEKDINKEVRKAMSDIENMEHSDYEAPEWASAKAEYLVQSKKRQLKIAEDEDDRRKRRRAVNSAKVVKPLQTLVEVGTRRYRVTNVTGVETAVAAQDVADEKERKKDMQRKRRREKALQSETAKAAELQAKAELVENAAERAKLLKDAAKAAKKARETERKMNGVGKDTTEDINIDAPPEPNLMGGMEGSFHIDVNGASPESPKKKHKGMGGRPKKSKEQKEAEKKAAEAAYEAEQRGEPIPIAPKDEFRDTPVREGKEPGKRGRRKKVEDDADAHARDLTPIAAPKDPFSSKAFLQIYDSIWQDIARKQVPKVVRIKGNSLETRQSNLRKTAQLASKEARRWQQRTNKSTKDVQARAKRNMREMSGFWKRNERQERDLRKVAEKAELDNAKRAEAEREANRQKRKLNFLISQTELYSHFIGKKIKTDEVERSTDSADVATTGEKVVDKNTEHTADLPADGTNAGPKVTNFEDLDFNSDDEGKLHEAAMANAQAAIQEAQDKARAFNNQDNQDENKDQTMAQFDEGEMNFQNPTSLGDLVLKQPNMLTVSLKDYQLKGLNWLANLYEQGINGILADEMGLGKTIQSISVMSYLAETHNIWGPFLVIAPASTLHNWQQEITRFVPDIKVLPYWGTAKDRKVLRKFWDRKHITYTKDSPFHVLVTSYQLVVQDAQYFQKIRWQYMILDEAQAIKSAQSSRWKVLLSFHCRNRLLLTGTPIQNNMQELWALLHFIMPSLFDSHDEFSDWFSKDIESHAQSNTKLNEDQLKRLHMILKPFMLRRVKKHVQKELGDKVEEDIFCDLTYRQRAIYSSLRNKISIMDLIEKAAVGDDQDTATLMNLVMQFRKVCNHPDLFERAETTSPLAMASFAETGSFLREGNFVNVAYSTHSSIAYPLPRLLCSSEGRLHIAGPGNNKAGFKHKYLKNLMNIWSAEHITTSAKDNAAFSWLRFVDSSASEVSFAGRNDVFARATKQKSKSNLLGQMNAIYQDEPDEKYTPQRAMFNIVERNDRRPLSEICSDGYMKSLMNVSKHTFEDSGLSTIEQCGRPRAAAPPITVSCSNRDANVETENFMFNVPLRKALYNSSLHEEEALLDANVDPAQYPVNNMLPEPLRQKSRFTDIQVPSMRRFVTDSGKLGKLDQLLRKLKAGGHRVLLYFQMTRMIDLMEEYLTYRNYKYCRLDGSTKLEDRRDTVADFQTRPEIFIFLLSTRAGGLGINLTSADTVIFYDSDWNPTIDSQAMDRAHRLGQTKQVTVYRMITRGTIEERIRKRSLQKEEMQRVVMTGGAGAAVNFDSRARENKTKDIAMWLADDEQAELIEKKEKEILEKGGDDAVKKRKKIGGRKKEVNVEDFYHEGEGHFDDGNKAQGAGTEMEEDSEIPKPIKRGPRGGKGLSKKAKTAKQRLAIADGGGD